jgi:hypothetical protein
MGFEIKITMNEGQPLQVEAPIGDKNLCYMLLLQAALLIKDADPTKIIPIGALPPGIFGKGGGRG